MTVIDNGGAVAIKGFNYQKASIILVMLNNYHKEEFKIIPEARDDFEVAFDNKRVFVQVKGTKRLSLTKLIGKNSDSIIKKNLLPGTSNDIRKIFLWDLVESTKDNLTLASNSNLVPPIYKVSDIQRDLIVEKLQLEEPFIERLNEQYIYITPFPNDIKVALTYLKGEMVNLGLITTDGRAESIIKELLCEIDQRSEIIIRDEDFAKKTISGDYLNKVFLTDKHMKLFENVLNQLPLNTARKMRIRLEKVKIPLMFQHIKEHIKKTILFDELLDESDEEIVRRICDVIENYQSTVIDENQKYAIAIDCFCDLGVEYCEN